MTMHILFVHQNFPAQFGHIARHLVQKLGWQCTFVSQTPPGEVEGISKIQYKPAGGATAKNHYCTRTFENCVWQTDAVLRALKARPDLRPDLIVGHSGFGSTLFLRELYPDVPVVNLFEYYYRAHDADSDMDFRSDLGWPVPLENYLRSYCRNAMILLDLQNCQRGYLPTQFQRSRFPEEYAGKIEVIFDGVDRGIYHGHEEQLRPPPAQRGPRQVCGLTLAPGQRLVTYVSRGFESMRGFDIFMQAADLIARRCPQAVFVVVGTDRICYGGDESHIAPHKTFRQWVLARGNYDLSRFHFTGLVPPSQLAQLLAMTDLHIYLTVPFVLSWSMMDALSCGAVVLGSNTTPVREMIQDGANGLLADFFSPEEFADKAVKVLEDPGAFRPLGRAAEEMIRQRYSLEVVLPRMLQLYEDAAARRPPAHPVITHTLAAERPRSPFRG